MALSATVQWDCRTGGNNSNGGGFDPGVASPGTDFSQQNSAQVAFTDLVIGATNTQLTSAGNPFSSASVGNIINITSGTGFTTGRYEILSVSGVTATMDRAVGTASSTGGHGNLGGSLIDVSTAVGAMATTGNTVNVQAGTYTYTSSTLWNSSFAPNSYTVLGYQTTHGDGGTPPLITTATNSVNLVGVENNGTVVNISNVNFSNTAGTKGLGVYAASGTNFPYLHFYKCKFTGFSYSVGGVGSSSIGGIYLNDCEIISNTVWGVYSPNTNCVYTYLIGCYIHGNTGASGGGASLNEQGSCLYRCLIVGNTIGAQFASGCYVDNCVVASNTSDGLKAETSVKGLFVSNSIIYGNGGFGINAASGGTPLAFASINNAYGSNTSGNFSGYSAGPNDVALTANPFVNSGSGNYALNNTSGGGTSCRLAGYPGLFAGGLTTGYLDIGAAQTTGGVAPPVPVAANLAGGVIGTAYSETISVTGGTPSFTFAMASGSLPTSTSLNTSTGIISGTPTVAGTYNFTIGVTDSLGATGSQAFQIIIANPPAVAYGFVN